MRSVRSWGMVWGCAAAVAALSACGGGSGGSGGSDTIQVVFSPASLSGSYVLNDPNSVGPGPVIVKATLSSTPTGAVYPVIVDPKSFLSVTPGQQIVVRNTDGSYSMVLQLRPPATAGVLEGELTLHLCKDSSCAAEYALSGATLPYRYDYAAALAVSLKVNGVPAVDVFNKALESTSGRLFQIAVPAGALLELNSTIPVTWSADAIGATPGTISPASSTATNWQGSVPAGASGNTITIKAKPVDTRQNDGGFTFVVQ